jgi:hypothetical protein
MGRMMNDSKGVDEIVRLGLDVLGEVLCVRPSKSDPVSSPNTAARCRATCSDCSERSTAVTCFRPGKVDGVGSNAAADFKYPLAPPAQEVPANQGPHSWAAGPSPRGAQGRVRPTASPWRRPSLSRGRDVATSGAASDGVNPRGPPLRVSEATGHRVDGGTELNVQRSVIDYGGTSTASSAASVRRRFVRSEGSPPRDERLVRARVRFGRYMARQVPRNHLYREGTSHGRRLTMRYDHLVMTPRRATRPPLSGRTPWPCRV